MIKFLKDSKSINLERVLLLRAKELQLDDQTAHILLLILTLDHMEVKTITPQLILKYTMCTPKQLDAILEILLKGKWIINHFGSIKLGNMDSLLLNKEDSEEEEKEINLVDIFENEFARTITPMELDTIREWKGYGYSDEMIVDALKEAVMAKVLNFRYIERILANWANNGVSRRFVDKPKQEDQVPVSDYKWWEDE